MLTTIWAFSMLWYFCKGNIKDHWTTYYHSKYNKNEKSSKYCKMWHKKTGSEQMLGNAAQPRVAAKFQLVKKYTVSAKCNKMKYTWITLSVLKWENWDSETPTAHLVRSWEEGSKHGCLLSSPLSLLFSSLLPSSSFPPFYSIFWRSVICLN